MDVDDSFDYLFKIVLIGDMAVGKTCIVQRFKSGTYIEKQGTTIGVDFTMKELVVDGKRIKLQIWDTGGQERFRTITNSYYRSANGIVLCYDITCSESFESLRRWIGFYIYSSNDISFLDDVSKFALPNVAIILIGTKLDIIQERKVDREVAEKLSHEYNMCGYVEVSSKDNINVDEIFLKLALQLKSQYDVGNFVPNEPSIRPNLFNTRNVSKTCCNK